MIKSEVYSWRMSPELKTAIEDEARREGESLADLLERVVREWLNQRRQSSLADEREQERIRAAAMKAIGSIAGTDTTRSRRVRELVRARLEKKHGRTR